VDVSIVIPCYRTPGTLPELTRRVSAVMNEHNLRYEVILVVDGSPDSTWDAASDVAAEDDHVRAIRLARNYGQHNAIIAGVRAAAYDVVVTMDDDLQHPPEEIPKLLAALTDDVDLVYGVPDVEEHGFARSLASRGIKAGMSMAMNVPNARLLGAFRAFRTFLRQGFDLVNGPHVSVDVALSWGTTRVAAAKVTMNERQSGRSGYTFAGLVKHTVNMLVGYSTTPLRLVTWFGFLVGFAGLALFARLLWQYYRGDTTVAGFTTIASLIAIVAAVQMIAIGVLGEYVGRIHAGGMGRPTYVIRERTDAAVRPNQAFSRPAVPAQRTSAEADPRRTTEGAQPTGPA
jgi:glycosyltransferase involved in cell wall biosynthesis